MSFRLEVLWHAVLGAVRCWPAGPKLTAATMAQQRHEAMPPVAQLMQ
jgi:hypothetical protein